MSLLLSNRAVLEKTLIPFFSDALFWLDGTISGNEFVDKTGNGRNFTITNKDFESGWIEGFPYKSKATISAPVADATLISADINNYLYDSGGTPNEIPVISLFQDVDYENKLFTRHISQVLNGGGAETIEPYVKDIVLYNTVKTSGDLTACQSYYDVPIEETTNVKWVDPVNGLDTNPGTKVSPWKTLEYADATATSGDTVYMRTGITIEVTRWNITNSVDFIGVGLCIVQASTTTFTAVHSQPAGYKTEGFYFDGQDLATTVFLDNSVSATNNNINRCLFTGTSDATNRYILNMASGNLNYNNCIFLGRIRNGRINSTIGTSQIKLNTCYVNAGILSVNDITLTNCKTIEPTTTTISLIGLTTEVNCTILGGTVDASARQIIDVDFAASATKDLDVNYVKRFTTSNIGGLVLQTAANGFNDINVQNSNIYITNDTSSNFIQGTGSISDINFLNNYVENTGDGGSIIGLSSGADGTLTFNNNTIINTSTSPTNNGIGVFSGSDYSFEFQNNYIRSNGTSNGISISKNTAVSGTVLINNNTIEVTGNASYAIRVGDEGTGAGDNIFTSVQITKNKVFCERYFAPAATTTTHAIFVGYQGSNTLVAYNYVNGGGLGIALKGSETDFSGTICMYNIVTKSYLYGIDCKAILGGVIVGNTLVENNTEFRWEINGADESANQVIKNNIAYNTSGHVFSFGSTGSRTGHTIDNNLLYYTDLFCFDGSSEINLATWQGYGFDNNSYFTDPLLTDFIPGAGSDAIGNGETLAATYDDGLDVTTDWGALTELPTVVLKQQGVNWDIGAYVI